MIEEEIVVSAAGITLAGTLCRPTEEGRYPTFLWIQGSGPIDRDDNMPGQELNNSKAIAHCLVEHGIASLRCDKRGVGESGGDYYSAGHSDLVEDSLACLKALSGLACCDEQQLYVMGHSMGSIMAPQLAALYPSLAGIVMIAPYIGDGETLLMDQARQLQAMLPQAKGFKGSLIRAYCKIFDPVRGQEKVIRRIKGSTRDVQRIGLQKQPMRWFREFLALDTQRIYRESQCPALLLAGSKDFQCPVEDVPEIEKHYAGPLQSVVIEDLSHLLRKEDGEPSIFTYAEQAKQDIDPRVLEQILSWMLCRIAASTASQPATLE